MKAVLNPFPAQFPVTSLPNLWIVVRNVYKFGYSENMMEKIYDGTIRCVLAQLCASWPTCLPLSDSVIESQLSFDPPGHVYGHAQDQPGP